MSKRTGTMMGFVAITLTMLAGCASNTAQVRTKGAVDLACDVSNVDVELTERPYVGVTRYQATGCGAARSYECRADFYSLGLPPGRENLQANRGGFGRPSVHAGERSVLARTNRASSFLSFWWHESF